MRLERLRVFCADVLVIIERQERLVGFRSLTKAIDTTSPTG